MHCKDRSNSPSSSHEVMGTRIYRGSEKLGNLLRATELGNSRARIHSLVWPVLLSAPGVGRVTSSSPTLYVGPNPKSSRNMAELSQLGKRKPLPYQPPPQGSVGGTVGSMGSGGGGVFPSWATYPQVQIPVSPCTAHWTSWCLSFLICEKGI